MKWFFYHNLDTCVGCCACQTACKDRNGLCTGDFFRRVAQVRLPNGKLRFYSGSCNHCERPACIAACPNRAFYKAPDGTVLHDDGKCIGCGKCVWSCPYGEVTLSRERGVAQKCDGCYDRRQRGQAPACVAACINRSLQFECTDGRSGNDSLWRTIPGVLPSVERTGPQIRAPLLRAGG